MSGRFARAGLLAIALLAGDAQAVVLEDAPAQAPAADRRAQAGAAVPAPQASAPPPPPRIASRYIAPPATGQVPQAAIVRLAQLPAADRRTRAGAAVPAPQVPAPPPPPRIASRYIAPPATREAPQAAVVRPAQAPAPDRRAQSAGSADIPAPQVPESRPAAPAPDAPERPQTAPDKSREAASPPPPRIASRYITPPATGQAPQATVVRLAQAPEPAAAAQAEAEPALAEQNAAAREAYRSASRAVGALVDRMRQAQAEVDRLRKGRDRQALRDARARARAVRAELLQARAARDAAKRERDRVILLAAAAAEQLKSADEIKALFASASGRAELASRLRQYPKIGEWNAVTVRNVTDAGMLVGVMEHAGFGVRYAPSGIAEDPHYAGLQSGARPLKGRWEGLVTGYYAGAGDGSAKHIGTGNALLEFNMGLSSDEVAGVFVFEDGFPVREALLVFAPINSAGEFSGTDWDFLLVPRDEISHLANARFNPSGFNPGAIRPYFIPSTTRDDLFFTKFPLTTTWDRVRVNGRMKGAVFGPEREEIAGLLLAKKFVNENLDGNLRAAFGAKETQPSVPTPEE